MSDRIELGDRVRFNGRETHQNHGASMGIYYLHSTDEYYMCGMVEIRDELGRVFPVNAALIEAVED